MIIGAHSIIYSTNAEADRVFLRDVLGLSHVDVGDGWLYQPRHARPRAMEAKTASRRARKPAARRRTRQPKAKKARSRSARKK